MEFNDIRVLIIEFLPDSRAAACTCRGWLQTFRNSPDYILWHTRPLLRAKFVPAKSVALFDFTPDTYARVGNTAALAACTSSPRTVTVESAVVGGHYQIAQQLFPRLTKREQTGIMMFAFSRDDPFCAPILDIIVRSSGPYIVLCAGIPRIIYHLARAAPDTLSALVVNAENICVENLHAIGECESRLTPLARARFEDYLFQDHVTAAASRLNIHELELLRDMNFAIAPDPDVYIIEPVWIEDELGLIATIMYVRKWGAVTREMITCMRNAKMSPAFIKNISASIMDD